jgi:hypothetical protein
MPKTTRFDAADYLDSEERQASYLGGAGNRRREFRARRDWHRRARTQVEKAAGTLSSWAER